MLAEPALPPVIALGANAVESMVDERAGLTGGHGPDHFEVAARAEVQLRPMPELENRIQTLENRVKALEERLLALESKAAQPGPMPCQPP